MSSSPVLDANMHVTCETTAANLVHVRELGSTPPKFVGHITPKPTTLCGSVAAWDTRNPVAAATCSQCVAALRGAGARLRRSDAA